MKALVYYGEQVKQWEDRPLPQLLKSTDAIVRIQHTTICGTDLHILKGNVETVAKGRILGHEGVGVIVECGDRVSTHKVGDRVLISCITSCGVCHYCKLGMQGHCEDGGWILGNTIDGCQAEYVRIPHADHSLYALAHQIEAEAYVMFSDILPTGLEVGVHDGKLKEQDTLAIIGAGPVGLAALMSARLYKPSRIFVVDINPHRLEVASSMGATDMIDNSDGRAVEKILSATQAKGVDVAIEAIGTPPGWYICEDIVKAGGHIAVLGVHGKPVTLHLERMWKKNFTLTAGLVHTTTIPYFMEQFQQGKLDPTLLISHRLGLSEMMKAYEIFSHAGDHQALKVLMTNDL